MHVFGASLTWVEKILTHGGCWIIFVVFIPRGDAAYWFFRAWSCACYSCGVLSRVGVLNPLPSIS